jgi:hypothetical protein
VPHPRPGVDYPESWSELRDWFPDDAVCLAYLERLRWPAGFVCPGCEGEHGWRMGDGLYRRPHPEHCQRPTGEQAKEKIRPISILSGLRPIPSTRLAGEKPACFHRPGGGRCGHPRAPWRAAALPCFVRRKSSRGNGLWRGGWLSGKTAVGRFRPVNYHVQRRRS